MILLGQSGLLFFHIHVLLLHTFQPLLLSLDFSKERFLGLAEEMMDDFGQLSEITIYLIIDTPHVI